MERVRSPWVTAMETSMMARTWPAVDVLALIALIEHLLAKDPKDRPATAFEDLGLSSMVAVTLATDLSEAFGIEVDALITWDYPTIGAAARAISEGEAGSLGEAGVATSSSDS